MKHFLIEASERFPRLKEMDFSFSDKDSYRMEFTPAGIVETFYFHERKNFENAVIALAYKLEKKPIPSSMGAMFLDGLVDRVNNCKTAVILLSRGGYSALEPSTVGLSEEEWLDKSFQIRKYHELAHYVQRKLYPQNKDALKDEIKADMVGIISAFGMYKPEIARLFLGTEGTAYREGGRLQNYIDESADISNLMKKANAYIDWVSELVKEESNAFNCQIKIEEQEQKNAKPVN